ncbi:concanavalin A-like lectin/glucanase domain-containing protein [Baffinella frigidus]|nr:concanavalin A-like lectin/glucanase domain-containing protein [Cryptophyta sp. CCMP2293]
MEGLKGRDSVFSQDRAEDPQISVTQITEVDYEAAPRKSVTYNWTRSVFEEVVRRRDELRLMLITALEALKKSRILIEQGLEPDPNGQVWLIIAMQQAEVTRIEMLYNETLGRDVKLFKEHRNEYLAIFPNSDYEKQCDDRLRLTPAAPTRRGAVWYEDQQFVTSGFTTTFKFQLSARNRFCRQKVEARSDQMKGTALTVQLDECLRAVWNSTEWAERVFGIGGGDGFAFVLQGAGPGAMGDRGSDLGYGGIEDSVAIEFDMYDNKEQGDVNDLHVAVHTGGCRKGNSGDSSTRLSSYGGLRTTGRFLQDGDFHYAKIEYTPGVHFNPQSQPLWSSSEYLQQFVKSDGIGTLRVWVGRSLDALSSTSEAVINMPLSIKYAMKLAEGKAYVGFTASTGSMWQNHDILEWEFKQYYPDPILACPPGLVARCPLNPKP